MQTLARLLILLPLLCGLNSWGQILSGKGFIPDPDGYRSDDPPPAQRPSPAAGQTIKDCADCPEMVVLPAGSFEMGSNENWDERPVHRVNVPSFLIGKTEVTQGQWKAVMGSNPSFFNTCGDDCPVEQVSWYDAQEFVRRLSQRTGKQYRLPSEAEWEYAARAGSSTKWSFGDSESQLGDHAWYRDNSKAWFGQAKTQRVAQKRPNAFGLYDMHGNVWEWVQDCWHNNHVGAPTEGSAWTTGCNGDYWVLRGGAWFSNPAFLRSAYRIRGTPDGRDSSNGLRLALSTNTPPLPTAAAGTGSSSVADAAQRSAAAARAAAAGSGTGSSSVSDAAQRSAAAARAAAAAGVGAVGVGAVGVGAAGASKSDSAAAATARSGPIADPRTSPKVIYFDYNSSEIKPEGAELIDAHARFLIANKTRQVSLEGHTDERGGREFNLALGQKRAEAVRTRMRLLGVTDIQMEAVSFGKEKPAAAGNDDAAHAKNRRTEINYAR